MVGSGNPAPDYDRLTPQYSSYTRIGVIDPETLEFIGYQTSIAPGFKIERLLDVDGEAWLFNSLSHMHERPSRVDVYVIDPRTLEITNRFNLDQPFPRAAVLSPSGDVYIHHASIQRWRDRWGNVSGITRLNPVTGNREFTRVDGPATVISDLAVYRDRVCAALGTRKATDGLWCMNDQGLLEFKIPQLNPDRVVFPPESRGRFPDGSGSGSVCLVLACMITSLGV